MGDKSNDYSQKIHNIIKESGYEENIRLIPVTKDPYKYFYIADIFVSTSIVDVMPTIVLMEAMAFEKPIIATDIFYNPRGIIHNKTGMLISCENMEYQIEKNIDYLLKNPDFMNELSKNAFNEYLEYFTFKTTLKKYCEIISL